MDFGNTLDIRQVVEDTGDVAVLYTDGAALTNPGVCGYAVIHQGIGVVASGRLGFGTNNRAELLALISAVRYLDGRPGIIYSDSKYALGIRQWSPSWAKRRWRTADKSPVANLDLVQELLALFEANPYVELRFVKSHSGNELNDLADLAAKSAAESELRG